MGARQLREAGVNGEPVLARAPSHQLERLGSLVGSEHLRTGARGHQARHAERAAELDHTLPRERPAVRELTPERRTAPPQHAQYGINGAHSTGPSSGSSAASLGWNRRSGPPGNGAHGRRGPSGPSVGCRPCAPVGPRPDGVVHRALHRWGPPYRVLDFGSGTSPNQTLTHRTLLEDFDCDYTGVDVRAGNNVDVVMEKPYRIPLKSKSFDIVLSGQVFEHVPFFWASLLEIARVMKPRAYFFMTVPSRGHVHTETTAGASTPMPCARWPRGPGSSFARVSRTAAHGRRAQRHRQPEAGVRAVDRRNYYWGDTVGVFQRPDRYPSLRAAMLRAPLRLSASRIGGLESVPQPAAVAERATSWACPTTAVGTLPTE